MKAENPGWLCKFTIRDYNIGKVWCDKYMNLSYKISKAQQLNGLVEIDDEKIYFPVKEKSVYEGIIIDRDSLESELKININEEENSSGNSCYVLNLAENKDVIDRLVDTYIESEEKVQRYALYFFKGYQCRRIVDKNKINILANIAKTVEKDGKSIAVGIVLTPSGNACLSISELKYVYRDVAKFCLDNISLDGSRYKISMYSFSDVIVSGNTDKVKKIVFQSRKSEDILEIPILQNENIKKDDKDGVRSFAEFDLKELNNVFKVNWDLFVVFEIGGQEYEVQLYCDKKYKSKEYTAGKKEIEYVSGYDYAIINITKKMTVMLYTGVKSSAVAYDDGRSFEELIKDNTIPFDRAVRVDKIVSGMGVFKIQLKHLSLEDVSEIAFMAYNKLNVYVRIIPVTIENRENSVISIDASELEWFCKTSDLLLKFGLAFKFGDEFIKTRIIDEEICINRAKEKLEISDDDDLESGSKDDEEIKDNINAIYFDNFISCEHKGKMYDGCPYVNKSGYIMMRIAEREKLTLYKVACEALKVKISDKYIIVETLCPGNERNWTGFVLDYKCKKEDDKDERYFKADIVKVTSKGVVMKVKIPLKDQKFKSTYWRIRACYEEDGYRYYASVKVYNDKIRESYKKLFQKNCKYYDIGDEKYILFPYVATNNNVNLMFRTSENNDGFKFRFKERAGLRIYQVFRKYLESKKIILVYEKYCYMAQDNGYQFFRYCMENNIEDTMNRKIYYVIDKKSPDYQKLKKYRKNVVNFMSIRFITYMLAAKLLVSSDVRSHAYAWRHRSSIIAHVIKKKKHIFLQHGVTAMKKVDNIFGKANGKPTNMFLVTSDDEYEIVSKYFGYNKNEIAITGFARWDVLEDKSAGRREILMMPTWRNWLDDVDSKKFKESEYYKNYMALLNSEKLNNILESNDVKLKFYIHPKFKDYIGNFEINAERVELIPFESQPLNELMMECNMLITDYSSVSWDVYYMNKPVIFYQFDIDTYMNTHGSYMDMKHDLFGDRTEDVNELINLIEKYIKKDFKMEEKYAREREKNFKYMDKNNCKRICDLIREKKF